jgi:hypothetical protein
MDLLDNDDDENKENVESALTVYGTNVKVEKNTVVIFNHKNKSGQDFKKEADLIIEYLISEGYVNKKKFKVKIITTSV